MHKRLKPSQQLLSQFGLLLIGLYVLVPIWGLLYLAFDGGIIGWPTSFRVWPEKPTLAVFQQVWEKPSQSLSFTGLALNSLLVSGGAALCAIVLGASMAYAFARYRFPGRKTGLFGLLVGALLPIVALMTPLYLLLTWLGVRTTLFGLMVVYTAFAMPFAVWNMRAAFQSVSVELEESAFLDGATPLRAFISITLPIAIPSIAVAGLIAFLIGYSEFAMGWLFVAKSTNVTLAMAISGVLNSSMISWSMLAALSALMSLPVVVVFLVLQRTLMERWLIGGIGDS